MEGKVKHSCQGHVTMLVLLLLVACTALIIVIIVFATREKHDGLCAMDKIGDTSSSEYQVCLTPSCVEVAALYLSNMDLYSDPCEDFFNYTCGGFVSKNPLADTDLIKDLGINKISQETDIKLVKLLEKQGTELYGEQSVAVGKLKNLYRACRNVSSNQRNNASALQKYIDGFGGWSFTGQQSDRITDLERTAAHLHRSYSEGLFKPWIVANPFNQNYYQIRFQASLATYPMASLYRTDTRARRKIASYISSVISLLGGDSNSSDTKQRIEEIIDMERIVMELTPSEIYRKNTVKTNNELTIKGVQDLIGHKFQVSRYLDFLLGSNVTEDYRVLVESPDYMSGIQDIFNNYSSLAIIDYLVWTWVHLHMIYLSEEFVEVYETFTRRAVKYAPDNCLQMTKKYFNQVLGALYVQEYYDKHADAEVSDMMFRLRQAFIENTQSVDWMEEVTKNKTKEKVQSMRQVVAYLDIHTKADKLDGNYVYSGEVIKDDFLGSVINLKRNYFMHLLSLIGEKQTIERAISELQAPYDTGATYAPYQNTILVWAGLMRYAFYDRRIPIAAKFGSLGFVVGHEVTHAFDNNGKNYDKNGNYIQWWDNETLANFDKRAKCYVEQYSQYTVVGNMTIDGNHTLGENIADNGAVKIAYSAYQSWLKNHGRLEIETRLPGLNLTAEQLFFLGMATPLCTTEAEILSIYNIKNDVHSQARYRIIGSLSNFEKFAEAFNCPVGSRMNPEDKCSIW